MGLFAKQGRTAAGCHPFAEWCKDNGVDMSVSLVERRNNELQTWNALICNGVRELAVNRSGDVSIWEIPEIDAVRAALEHGLHDDEASDAWLELIDHATNPEPMVAARVQRAAKILRWFSQRADYMQVTIEHGADLFDTPALSEHYHSALKQVVELTGVTIDSSASNTV